MSRNRLASTFLLLIAAFSAIALLLAPLSSAQGGRIELASNRRVEQPAKLPAQASARPQTGLMFAGTQASDFAMNQSAPGAVTQAQDPSGGSEPTMKMTVSNADVYPITPTDNPRAQLCSPSIFQPGEEFWWHSKFFLPAAFPASVPGWLTVLEGPYGAPFAGSPPWHIEVNGDSIRWQRNGTYDYDIPWEMPLVRNQWVEVLLHERFGSNGWVEMWVNGQPITFFTGEALNLNGVAPTTHLSMQTMDQSNDQGPNFAVIQSYRQANMFSSVSLFQGPMLIGKTKGSVEG